MKSCVLIICTVLMITSSCKQEVPTIKKSENMEKSYKETANRNKESVKRIFGLIEEANIKELIEMFSEDAVQINPYASGLFPDTVCGKQELNKYWEPVPGLFDNMEFIVHELYVMEDPNIVFVKYSGNLKLKNNEGYYNNDYYSTFKFNQEGKITEYVEIFNPIKAAKGFGLLDKIK